MDNVRSGKGPYFLEFETYRWREHCGPNFDNDLGYRSNDEFLKWKGKCPIKAFETLLSFASVKQWRYRYVVVSRDVVNFLKASRRGVV